MKSTAAIFATTHWSVVLAAGQGTDAQASEALEKLCCAYWYPLYAYVRRRGYDVQSAEDMVQGFFARLLEKNSLAGLEPLGGKFRSYLLVAMNRFLANEREHAGAAKRGGGRTVVSLDDESAEAEYRLERASDLSPEKLYDQRWALAVMEQAMTRLREEFTAGAMKRQFDRLHPYLSQQAGEGEYAAAAAELDMTPNAVAVAVHRLRQRYRELVRAEIANTVSAASEIDEELRYLLSLVVA
jgi:RNA polymerase sigma-70 factor (ECF subfamily)